jgi:putative transposase
MRGLGELIPVAGVKAACAALRVPRAWFYRKSAHASAPAVGSAPMVKRFVPRALTGTEREAVLACLHEERFQNCAPAAVYATLLDEGRYYCSIRTMYRILAGEGEARERRDQLVHPAYTKPELLATRPNQLWSWDITKLPGPAKWTYFYLYVILDVLTISADSWSALSWIRRTFTAAPVANVTSQAGRSRMERARNRRND